MALRPDPCDPRGLDLFLRQRLSADRRRELEAHLLDCPACRTKLDDLAGGPRWWTEVRRYLGSDGAAEMLRTADWSTPPSEGGVNLDFLQPSTNPAALGRLGEYEVLEVLGQGGFGIVLKAFDSSLHRPVAIKVLTAEYAANGAARQRFVREAQAAAAVSHDHVVAVHAVNATAVPPYLVMAFIAGQSLQQRIDRSGPLELKEILRIGMQTASGLAAAHAQGLVHRDIKPSNIMLENGIERVRITDFGLARAADDTSVSLSGAVAGTPQYMAPEQARGEPLDQRADLFALGSTLYAMCTGRAPFRGTSALAVIRQVCDVEPAPIRSLNPDIPAWLEGIVRKLQEKDPSQRLGPASEVADLLERCLAHVQQPERQPLPPLARQLDAQVRRPQRRRRTVWQAAAAAVLAAFVSGGAVIWWYGPTLPGRAVAPHEAGPSAAASAPAASLEGLEDLSPDRMEAFQEKLDQLRRSLTEPQTGDETPNEALVANAEALAQKTQAIQRALTEASEAGWDPVSVRLSQIHHRLKQIRNRLEAMND